MVAIRKAGRAAAACGHRFFTNFRTALAVRINLAAVCIGAIRAVGAIGIDKANGANGITIRCGEWPIFCLQIFGRILKICKFASEFSAGE
jgi:hypothetical protein